MTTNVIPFPAPAVPTCRWVSDVAPSGCSVTIQATGVVDRVALAAQLRDLASTVEGPLGRAFFGAEAS